MEIEIIKIMESNQEQNILALRANNLTPKQIARKLGLKVSEVTAVIKNQAEEISQERIQTGELYPLEECLVTANCAYELLKLGIYDEDFEGASGVGIVVVTRKKSHDQYLICSYLIDYWCLGVKDAITATTFKSYQDYQNFVSKTFSTFYHNYEKISIDQAREIVWGAVEYAKTLGFQPHRDFAKTISHLGVLEGKSSLKFGKEGKPFYVAGPYDNRKKIINTLIETVGEGNFDSNVRIL